VDQIVRISELAWIAESLKEEFAQAEGGEQQMSSEWKTV
jgi:hypothetical protein